MVIYSSRQQKSQNSANIQEKRNFHFYPKIHIHQVTLAKARTADSFLPVILKIVCVYTNVYMWLNSCTLLTFKTESHVFREIKGYLKVIYKIIQKVTYFCLQFSSNNRNNYNPYKVWSWGSLPVQKNHLGSFKTETVRLHFRLSEYEFALRSPGTGIFFTSYSY